MTKSKRKLPVMIGVILFAGFIVAMVWSTTGSAKFRCEVCMAYRGQTVCRNGGATTRQEAQRIATESACSDLGAGGFSNCRNGEPASVTWK
jgi:hypothetical protein